MKIEKDKTLDTSLRGIQESIPKNVNEKRKKGYIMNYKDLKMTWDGYGEGSLSPLTYDLWEYGGFESEWPNWISVN